MVCRNYRARVPNLLCANLIRTAGRPKQGKKGQKTGKKARNRCRPDCPDVPAISINYKLPPQTLTGILF